MYPVLIEKAGHLCMVDIPRKRGFEKLRDRTHRQLGKDAAVLRYGPDVPDAWILSHVMLMHNRSVALFFSNVVYSDSLVEAVVKCKRLVNVWIANGEIVALNVGKCSKLVEAAYELCQLGKKDKSVGLTYWHCYQRMLHESGEGPITLQEGMHQSAYGQAWTFHSLEDWKAHLKRMKSCKKLPIEREAPRSFSRGLLRAPAYPDRATTSPTRIA